MHHILRMPTLVDLLCLTIMRYWTDETKHMWLVILSFLFVLETMDVKRIKDLWHTMTQRKKVSSVSSKLTIRLDRTLWRFLRPGFLNSHSPISWRMLTWRSLIQAVPCYPWRGSQGSPAKREESVWAREIKEDYHNHFRISLEHSTRWVHQQWRWQGGSSSWARVANRGRPAKVHQKTPHDCVRFLTCAYMFKYHLENHEKS